MKMYVITLFTILQIATAIGYAQVVVIANKSVPEISLTYRQLSDIYTLRIITWSDESNIVPFTFKADNETTQAVFGSFGKSVLDMKKLWMKMLLSGEGQPPKALDSEEEMVEKVASTPGAIGFVDASKVTDEVKVLAKIE